MVYEGPQYLFRGCRVALLLEMWGGLNWHEVLIREELVSWDLLIITLFRNFSPASLGTAQLRANLYFHQTLQVASCVHTEVWKSFPSHVVLNLGCILETTGEVKMKQDKTRCPSWEIDSVGLRQQSFLSFCRCFVPVGFNVQPGLGSQG